MTAASIADSITTGGKEISGEFIGYEQSRFLFKDSSGRQHRYLRSAVSKLEMQTPYHISYEQSGKRDRQHAVLEGYANGKYTLTRDGKKALVPGIQLRQITIEQPASDKPVNGGNAVDGLPPVDIATLRQRPDLTAAQSAAIDQYEGAFNRHSAFREESSALVTQMDNATGDQRMKLLATLRNRKNEEQPLLDTLQASRIALEAAIPDLNRREAIGANEPAGDSELILTIPDYEAGAIFLVDTTFLRQNMKLSAEQKEVVTEYNARRDQYMAGSSAANPEKQQVLAEALLKAQKDLLAAFPELKIVKQ